MDEDRGARCVRCGGELGVWGPPLCENCRRAEFCLGCGRDGAARAAGGGRNQPPAWCGGCVRCADCTGRAHCMRPMSDRRVHGVCEGCLNVDDEDQICGACVKCCHTCCGCAQPPEPAVCTGCNLRPVHIPGDRGALRGLCVECRWRRFEAAEAEDDAAEDGAASVAAGP